MENLIQEAIDRKEEIIEKSKNVHGEYYLALYESDNGYTVGQIRQGHVVTSMNYISFGRNLTESHFDYIISREKEDLYYEKLSRGEI